VTEDKKVIHVDFGGGIKKRLTRKPPSDFSSTPGSWSREQTSISDLYSLGDVAKLFAMEPSRLNYWERSKFITRSGTRGKRRFYTFLDLVSIRTAKGLLDKGVPLAQVRHCIDALRTSLPKSARPLNSLRVFADGQTLVVKDDRGSFEPSTGQTVINFEVSALRDDVVRVLGRERAFKQNNVAYDFYLEGCRLDQDERTLEAAENSYRRAIEIDPSFTNAFINLGNLLYRQSKADMAELMYTRALQIDPDQPEACYNMGFLLYDRGDIHGALDYFQRCIRTAPSFADAHFNLAMVFEDLGKHREARPHWETYLRLDPTSAWAEIARSHLIPQITPPPPQPSSA
jgi:tetratricopeptide (TPR) repeat protein